MKLLTQDFFSGDWDTMVLIHIDNSERDEPRPNMEIEEFQFFKNQIIFSSPHDEDCGQTVIATNGVVSDCFGKPCAYVVVLEETERICSECGRIIRSGYYVEDYEYYCSHECLHKHYTPEAWAEICNDGEGYGYYTEWDDTLGVGDIRASFCPKAGHEVLMRYEGDHRWLCLHAETPEEDVIEAKKWRLARL